MSRLYTSLFSLYIYLKATAYIEREEAHHRGYYISPVYIIIDGFFFFLPGKKRVCVCGGGMSFKGGSIVLKKSRVYREKPK